MSGNTERNFSGIVAGPAKQGKTFLALCAMPDALYLGRRDAIEPIAVQLCGYAPKSTRIWEAAFDLVTLVAILEHPDYAKHLRACRRLVVDDFTHRCESSVAHWERTKPTGRKGNPDDFYPYKMLKHYLIRFSNALERLNIDYLLVAHMLDPDPEHDRPGGANAGSGGQVKNLPAWFAWVALLWAQPEYPDPWWPKALFCDPTDSSYVTADRFHVTQRISPPSLRELLRTSYLGASAYPMPKGLEWHDDIADRVCAEARKGPSTIDSWGNVADRMAGLWRANGNPWDSVTQTRFTNACQAGFARAWIADAATKGRFAQRRYAGVLAEGAPLPPGALPGTAAASDAIAATAAAANAALKAGDAPTGLYAAGEAPLPT